jgi:hypothetical protein
MQFALLIFESPEAFAARNGDGTDPYTSAWRPYYRALVESGSYVAGHPLEVPETGTTVRLKEGKRRVQDGPFADTKEQLAGFIILELPRLTRRSIGQRAARQPRQVLWRSAPLHLKPCGGSRDERRREGGHSSDDRARSPRVIRSPGGLPFLAHAGRGQRGGRTQ